MAGNDLSGGETAPGANVHLAPPHLRQRGHPEYLAQNLGRVQGPLQVTGIDRAHPPPLCSQPLGQAPGLLTAGLTERHIRLPLPAVFLVPHRLAVSDQ